jgi:hypothetical protein
MKICKKTIDFFFVDLPWQSRADDFGAEVPTLLDQ